MALTTSVAGVVADISADDPRALLRDARILLVTPHPDDESLAAGGLIQHALHLGARLRILQVTDGDNNPWPQRVLERRVVIGAAGRRRWAQRRRLEVQAAADALGLPADTLQYMSWPDMGVTARLRADGPAAIEAFATQIDAWRPTVVVLPALGDTHPDHGSTHVLTRLALARLHSPAVCLEYLVHGAPCVDAHPWTLDLTAAFEARKRDAVLAHHSQVALSRTRLLARVGCRESFQRLLPDVSEPLPELLALPWRAPRLLTRQVHLSLAHAGGVHDWPWCRAPLLRSADGRYSLQLPADVPRQAPLFARLDMRIPSPWIFDTWGWRRLTAVAAMSQA